MATLVVSFAAGTHQGAQLRQLSKAIQRAATNCPDNVPGQAVTLTIDNAPSSGVVSVAVSAPYASGTIIV